MWLIGMLLVGLIVGVVAKLLMPGRDPGGMLVTMLLGVAGAVIAGVLGRSVGWFAVGEPVGFIASTIGAVLILALYRATRRGTSARPGGRIDRAA